MPTFDTLYQKVMLYYAQPLSVVDADWKCLESVLCCWCIFKSIRKERNDKKKIYMEV